VLLPLLAALPALLPGVPQASGDAGPLTWQVPEGLESLARPMSEAAGEELARIEDWLGLPPAPAGNLQWVESRQEFEKALGNNAPDWFAAVTIPSQRRIVMLADRSKSGAVLSETLRHELVHWAMIGVGDQAWQALPAWFHEGVAETWARTDPLSQFASPLAWRAFRGDLDPLVRFRDGFGAEPLAASEGYALAYAFVKRLVRVHGEDVIARILERVRRGDSLDQSLIGVTGLGLISHEEALRAELGSWGALLGEIYPQLFLFLALFMLLIAPFVWRARRRRRRAFEAKWAREDAEALAQADQPEDDRWITPR